MLDLRVLNKYNEYNLKEGLIITEDQSEEIILNGKKIIVVPIWRWLLENE